MVFSWKTSGSMAFHVWRYVSMHVHLQYLISSKQTRKKKVFFCCCCTGTEAIRPESEQNGEGLEETQPAWRRGGGVCGANNNDHDDNNDDNDDHYYDNNDYDSGQRTVQAGLGTHRRELLPDRYWHVSLTQICPVSLTCSDKYSKSAFFRYVQ